MPESAELHVTEILSDENDYDKYVNDAANALSTEERIMSVDNARFFDITILDGEVLVEPKVPVTVVVELSDGFASDEDATVLHYVEDEVKVIETVDPAEAAAGLAASAETAVLEADSTESIVDDTIVVDSSIAEEAIAGEPAESIEEAETIVEDASLFPEEIAAVGAEPAEVFEAAETEGITEAGEPDTVAEAELPFDETMNSIAFVADSFSVYGFVTATLEKTILASDGSNYKVTVSFGPEAEIPEGAELFVEELDEESYREIGLNGLTVSSDSQVGKARFFKVKIMKDGEELEIKDNIESS